MAQGLTGLGQSAALDGVFEARMERATSTELRLQRHNGSLVEVNGDVQIIPASTLVLTTGAGGSDTINSSGADSGSKTAVSTLYYAYVSSSRATTNPNAFRLSTTAPSLYNGRKYLATSGNGAEWRFIGWVRTDASGNLIDSDTQRLVVNYYNRRIKRLYQNPAYADANSQTTYTDATTTWHAINAGTNAKVELISNGEDTVIFAYYYGATIAALGNDFGIGIGITSTSQPKVANMHTAVSTLRTMPLGITYEDVIAEGFLSFDMLTVTAGSTMTIYADDGRRGAGADVPVTFGIGLVMV